MQKRAPLPPPSPPGPQVLRIAANWWQRQCAHWRPLVEICGIPGGIPPLTWATRGAVPEPDFHSTKSEPSHLRPWWHWHRLYRCRASGANPGQLLGLKEFNWKPVMEKTLLVTKQTKCDYSICVVNILYCIMGSSLETWLQIYIYILHLHLQIYRQSLYHCCAYNFKCNDMRDCSFPTTTWTTSLNENASVIPRGVHYLTTLSLWFLSSLSGRDPALHDVRPRLLLHQDLLWAELQLHRELGQRGLPQPAQPARFCKDRCGRLVTVQQRGRPKAPGS